MLRFLRWPMAPSGKRQHQYQKWSSTAYSPPMSEPKPISNLLQRLRRKEQRGSKPRCHFLTHGEPLEVARRLTSLIHPWGYVAATDSWMPKGLYDAEEAQLHKAKCIIPSQNDRDVLRSWWLADPRPTSTTPSWDIASTCAINGQRGLLLVEAKAHESNHLDTPYGAALASTPALTKLLNSSETTALYDRICGTASVSLKMLLAMEAKRIRSQCFCRTQCGVIRPNLESVET
jgi:hypothetical protein